MQACATQIAAEDPTHPCNFSSKCRCLGTEMHLSGNATRRPTLKSIRAVCKTAPALETNARLQFGFMYLLELKKEKKLIGVGPIIMFPISRVLYSVDFSLNEISISCKSENIYFRRLFQPLPTSVSCRYHSF